MRGERVLTGRFDEDRTLLGQPSVLDVRLAAHDGGREVCVRVPATGPDVTYVSTKRWSFGARFAWRRSLVFTQSGVPTWGVSVGRWVGPVRLGLEASIGGTNDPAPDYPHGTGLCFLAPGPDCDRVTMGGLTAEASGLGWRWKRWALGWSLGYEAFYAGLSHKAPAGGPMLTRRASSGGPRLGVQLLRVIADVAGVSRFGPTRAWGFEVFVAAGQEWTGEASGSPVTFGLSLLGF